MPSYTIGSVTLAMVDATGNPYVYRVSAIQGAFAHQPVDHPAYVCLDLTGPSDESGWAGIQRMVINFGNDLALAKAVVEDLRRSMER